MTTQTKPKKTTGAKPRARSTAPKAAAAKAVPAKAPKARAASAASNAALLPCRAVSHRLHRFLPHGLKMPSCGMSRAVGLSTLPVVSRF